MLWEMYFQNIIGETNLSALRISQYKARHDIQEKNWKNHVHKCVNLMLPLLWKEEPTVTRQPADTRRYLTFLHRR